MKEPLTTADRIVIFHIVGIYAFFSALWIYLSDEVVALFSLDPARVLYISIFKGLLFIALTSYLLTHLIAGHIRTYRKADRNLLESEERYRQLVENSPDAILIEDGAVFTFANPAARSLLRAATPEEVIGKPVLDFVSPESREVATERSRQLLEEMPVVPLEELSVVRLDGTLVDVEIVGVSITSGGKRAVQVMVRDITERKMAQRALQKLNEELEVRVRERTAELEESRAQLKTHYEELQRTYNELAAMSAERIRAMEELREKDRMMIQQSRMAAMGEMLGNIAHQWRQPLNILALAIQDLGLSYECGGFSKESLDAGIDKAMKVVLHLSETIDDFRNFAAPDTEKSLFSVDQLIRKTVSLVEESFRSQHISFDIRTSGDPEINGYPHEYAQVLLNILMNARDAFVERRIENARITIRSWKENGRSVVTVTDNAGGIEPVIIGRIFDAYFTTKELGKGTGVGLFMSKTIIEKNMGGRLSARNTDTGVELRIEV